MTQPNDSSTPNPSPSALTDVFREHPRITGFLGGLIVIIVFCALTTIFPGLVSPLPLVVKVSGGGHYGITFPFLFGATIPLTLLGVTLSQRYMLKDTERRYLKVAIPSLVSYGVLLAITSAITRSKLSLVDSSVSFLYDIPIIVMALILILIFASLVIRKKWGIFVILTLIEIICFYVPAVFLAFIYLI